MTDPSKFIRDHARIIPKFLQLEIVPNSQLEIIKSTPFVNDTRLPSPPPPEFCDDPVPELAQVAAASAADGSCSYPKKRSEGEPKAAPAAEDKGKQLVQVPENAAKKKFGSKRSDSIPKPKPAATASAPLPSADLPSRLSLLAGKSDKAKKVVPEPSVKKSGGSKKKRSGSKAQPESASADSLLSLLSGPPDMRYANMDILDVATMRGIVFEPPRWHRDGGYDAKPKEK